MTMRSALAVSWLVLAAWAAGCGGRHEEDGDADSDADTDLDADGDVDGDADGDVDADGEGDGDTDADGDGDPDQDADEEPPPCGTERVREELGIPTLDGYELSAFLDRPSEEDCPLPTILIQTPYDKEGAWTTFFGEERSSRPLFASPRYNYVVVDWRGRFGSRDLPHAGDGAWLAQDSYDTVEWIAAQPWSDGAVGTWGVSALCGVQYRTAAGPRPTTANPDFADGPPPHLRAMVPIMCAIRPSFSQVYPGGVLRHEYATTLDALGFGLRAMYENNPRENALWDLIEGANPVDRMRVPALVIGGFYDLMPSHTVAAFHELVAGSDPSVRDQHRLLIGPWIHFAAGGELSEGAVRPLTEEERGFMDFERVIDRDSLAFFDLHLRGLDSDAAGWAAVRYFHENDGWQSADSWPPAGVETQPLYLHADGSLNETVPSSGSAGLPYDPTDPSPSVGGATLSPYNCVGDPNPLLCTLTPDPDNILLHGPTSQASVLARSDQLLFTTMPLVSPLRLLGPARVFVDLSTTGLDTDVAVRLVDVDPAGDPRLIAEGIQRLSARDDARTFSEVEPGTRYEVEVSLLSDLAYTIPSGHRLGVILTASHWPLFARNPADGAVFMASDVTPSTDETFTYGWPRVTVDLQGEGAAADNTVYFEGTTWIALSVAP